MSKSGGRSSSRFVVFQTVVLVATLVLLAVALRRLARLSRQVDEIGERQVTQGVGQRPLSLYYARLLELRARRVPAGPDAFARVAPSDSTEELWTLASAGHVCEETPRWLAEFDVLPDAPVEMQPLQGAYRESLVGVLAAAGVVLAEPSEEHREEYRRAWDLDDRLWTVWMQEVDRVA
jgi:hypothetical protein